MERAEPDTTRHHRRYVQQHGHAVALIASRTFTGSHPLTKRDLIHGSGRHARRNIVLFSVQFGGDFPVLAASTTCIVADEHVYAVLAFADDVAAAEFEQGFRRRDFAEPCAAHEVHGFALGSQAYPKEGCDGMAFPDVLAERDLQNVPSLETEAVVQPGFKGHYVAFQGAARVLGLHVAQVIGNPRRVNERLPLRHQTRTANNQTQRIPLKSVPFLSYQKDGAGRMPFPISVAAEDHRRIHKQDGPGRYPRRCQ